MKIIFIGGFFPDDQIDMIYESSSGPIQNAAHVFQSNLLKGFDAVFSEGATVLNLPFIGSYPLRFNKIYYPKSSSVFLKNTKVNGVGFLNLTFIKYYARFLSTLIALLGVKKTNNECFFIYSMHLPFVAAAVISKKIKFNKSKICLIVPDLPEYMSGNRGFFYNLFKKVESGILSFFLKGIDDYILLTGEMAKKLKLQDEQYIVVEGIADNVELYLDLNRDNKRVVFYSGTLAKRYGVCDLVDAFSALDDENLELWICGDGDSKNYISNMQKSDVRIKYLGQLPRDQVVKLQQKATVLVNPRGPQGEYTKYSFPSKVMEYMSSGRPVVMHRLPGIPAEYFDYCYTPATSSVLSLNECLNSVLKISDEELTATGIAAKDFVINNKSYIKQAEKIKKFILRSI